jgi:DNA replication and repair protein RecF
LAGHRSVADAVGSPPVLLLDDVFSELDPARSEALLAHLPAGQALLTTAGEVPPAAHPSVEVRVVAGKVLV